MGLRDRLKRRLGRTASEPERPGPSEPPRQRGPIRSRIDYAQVREDAPATEPEAGDDVLDDGFWEGDDGPQDSDGDDRAQPRYDEHPIQHPVQVTNPETGEVLHFTVAPGETVLDGADRAGLELPSSCRAGGCLSCSGKRLVGDVSLDEQFVLDEDHLVAGFVLLCGTRVSGPATFLSHQQEAID
jgi:ferredoxin